MGEVLPFEDYSFYDSLDLVGGQIAAGKASWEALVASFNDQSRLTPEERVQLVDHLKVGNPVVDGVLEVASNPLVWLAFVISPSGAQGLRRAGQSLFSPKTASAFHAWSAKKYPWLAQMLGSAHTAGRGTPLVDGLEEWDRRMQRLTREEHEMVQPVVDAWIRKQKGEGRRLRSLDPEDGRNWREKQYLKKVGYAMVLSMNRMDVGTIRPAMVDMVPDFRIEVGTAARSGKPEQSILLSSLGDDGDRIRAKLWREFKERARKDRESIVLEVDSWAPWGPSRKKTPKAEDVETLLWGEVEAGVGTRVSPTKVRAVALPQGQTAKLMPVGRDVPEPGLFDAVGPGWTDESAKLIDMPSAFLQREGLMEVRNAYESAMLLRILRGAAREGVVDDAVRQWKTTGRIDPEVIRARWGEATEWVDPEKVFSAWKSTRQSKVERLPPVDEEAAMEFLMGVRQRERIYKGDAGTYEQFLQDVTTTFGRSIELGQYFPRRNFKFKTATIPNKLRRTWHGYEARPDMESLRDLPEEMLLPRGGPKNQGTVLQASHAAYVRKNGEVAWDPQELEEIRRLFVTPSPDGATPALQIDSMIRRAYDDIEEALVYAKDLQVAAVRSLDFLGGTTRFFRTTGQTVARTQAAPDWLVAMQRDALREAQPEILAGGAYEAPLAPAEAVKEKLTERLRTEWLLELGPEGYKREVQRRKGKPKARWVPRVPRGTARADIPEELAPQMGMVSLDDIIEDSLHPTLMKDGERRQYFLGTVIPAVTGHMDYPYLGMRSAASVAQKGLNWMLRHTDTVEAMKSVPGLKQTTEFLEDMAHHDPEYIAKKMNDWGAKIGYTANLGFNLASVTLNLMQPWLLAATHLGMRNVGAAYKDAMVDLGRYWKIRQSPPYQFRARLSNDEYRRIVEQAFPYHQEMGLTGEVFRDIDSMLLERMGTSQKMSWGELLLSHGPLKLFEQAEWLNRLVAIHATKRLHLRTGAEVQLVPNEHGLLKIDPDFGHGATVLKDMRIMNAETQFGSGVFNTPGIFLTSDFGRLFRNPILRQFKTFATRSFANPWLMAPSMAGGQRTIHLAGHPILVTHGSVAAGALDFLRMMGISALVYEGMKAVTGINLSHGLAMQATFEGMLGGDRYLEREDVFPGINPLSGPIQTSIWNMVKGGILGGEERLFRDSIVRLFPGGVALQRASGVMGDKEEAGFIGGLIKGTQRTYADWDNPGPDGKVPLYKGSGELIGFESPLKLVLQGLGVDMKAHRHAGNIDHWLTTQRDEVVRYRQQYLNHLLANNVKKAQDVSAEFTHRFGIPLTFTKSQLRALNTRRTISRSERILDRTPTDLRPQLMEALRAEGGRMGLTEEQLFSGATAGSRDVERQNVQFSPEALEELYRHYEGAQTSPSP